MSSANNEQIDTTSEGGSAVHNTNNMGRRTDPCGDMCVTWNLRYERKILIHPNKIPFMPHDFNFKSSRRIGTLSKALEKSR